MMARKCHKNTWESVNAKYVCQFNPDTKTTYTVI